MTFTSPLLAVFCADMTLGRVDKSMISQQTLMELFIEHVTKNRHRVCSAADFPAAVSEWTGLKFYDDADIKDLSWSYLQLGGSLQLEWLPNRVTLVYVNNNFFTGTVSLTQLPSTLRRLSLAYNQLSGPVDVTQLPEEMTGIFLNRNDFEGEADFSHLPASLEFCWVSWNRKLSGTLTYTGKQKFKADNSQVDLVKV